MTQLDDERSSAVASADAASAGLEEPSRALRLRRSRRPAAEWRHDPWDDPDETRALMVERQRRSRWPFKVLAWTIGALLVVGVLIAGSLAWWYVHEINPSGDPAPAENFTINDGETIETLSVRLQDDGFITNARVFRWYVKHQGGLDLTPGYYQVRPMDHMGNIMRVLRTPPAETYADVTFPEGFTVDKMASRLVETFPRLTTEDFIAAATNGTVTSDILPEGTTSLEGLLFPDTYQISNGETASQVVARMVALTERVARQEQIIEGGYAQHLSAYQVLIVASMVEREAKTDADRPLIARVILNRLFAYDQIAFPGGMPLQIDATLFYGQDPSLTFGQLKDVDTPYNTYLHTGLPPTPIANPGRASIEAVVNPAADPPEGGALCKDLPKDGCHYYYYVLADEDGNHAFAVTLAQHEANVAVAREKGLLDP